MLTHTGVLVRFAGVVGLLGACQVAAPTDPSADQAVVAAGTGTGGRPSGSNSVSARVRCEVRSHRSKISVDGRYVSPADGRFTARAKSGANSATAPAKAAVAGEVEFDFDSDSGDIGAGAVAISPSFIGTDVTGEILDASGKVVATGTAKCTVK